MKKEVIVIIAVCIVVAIITAFVTTNLTGNVVSVGWWNKHQVYTVGEVDKLIEDLNNGDTPIYYTKSEIDNLLKNLATGEIVTINNNDTYTKSQIDSKISSISGGISKQQTLDMLNSCEIVRTASGVCDPECAKKSKTCIFGDAVFQVQSNTESLKISQVVGCQEADVQSLFDMYTQAGYTVNDVDASCVCCSA